MRGSKCRHCDRPAGTRVWLGDPNAAEVRVAFCPYCDLPKGYDHRALPVKLRSALIGVGGFEAGGEFQ
jgi:hypothetical protein